LDSAAAHIFAAKTAVASRFKNAAVAKIKIAAGEVAAAA
jgi:hypothetical protein